MSFFQVQVDRIAGIRVLSLTGGMIGSHSVDEVATLLARDATLVWVDVPECSDQAVTLLTDVLKCHPLAVRDCMQRNRVPRVRIYPHQQLLILHGPERGPSSHVHYLALDQIIGEKYVVTVPGPINPTVPIDVALRETDGVRKRIEAGRLRPDSPYELSYAITSALTHRLKAFIEDLTRDVWDLERRVTGGHMGNPEEFLEELFGAWHGLLAVRMMGALGAEVLGRVAALEARIPVDERPLIADATDQMNRIRNLADGEREYGALLDLRHEHHRQRHHPRHPVGRGALDHGWRGPSAAAGGKGPHGGTGLTVVLAPGHHGPHAAEGHPSHRRSGGRSGALRQRLLS